MKNSAEKMKSLPLFQKLDQVELERLALTCHLLEFKRGEVLFSAGHPAEHVYIIIYGSAKLVRAHPDGKERIVHLLIRGEMFGAAVAMQSGYYPVNAITLEQSCVLKIKSDIYRNIFLNHPIIGQTLVAQLSERVMQAHSDRVMSFDPVDKRIAIFLLELLERVQGIFGSTTRIPVPLTRQDIADRVGSTVETVIRHISLWSKQKIIKTQDRYIEILDPQSLRSKTNT
jgi:CRP-like cAMP-binding protein